MAMSKVHIKIYEIKSRPCTYCRIMRTYFENWEATSRDEVIVEEFDAEAHPEELEQLGARSAPVYVIKRGRRESVVYGNNPDVLVDALSGVDGVWDF